MESMSARGFTLIELVVILLIVGVILGLVGIAYTRSPVDEVREEAERLAQLLQVAQDEATTQGRLYGVELAADGYRFLVLDDTNTLVGLDHDELLRAQRLTHDVEIGQVLIEGTSATGKARIVFVPTGSAPNFDIVLRKQDARWYVKGTADGQIRAAPTIEPQTNASRARLHAA